ncbi:MAG: hypothetical protein PVS3B1_18440 [Ktedonobacteraceae bacterium]
MLFSPISGAQNVSSKLLKSSCERRLIAASESATVEVKQADQWRRTGAVIQALSLTQLNGMLFGWRAIL